MPIDTFLLALTTFFATLGPADLLVVYAALTQKNTQAERRAMALRGTVIAAVILLFFAVFGEVLLKLFGITLPALRIAIRAAPAPPPRKKTKHRAAPTSRCFRWRHRCWPAPVRSAR